MLSRGFPSLTGWAVLISIVLLSGCSLPVQQMTQSFALTPDAARSTRLGQTWSKEIAAHPGTSGIHALPNPQDAFAARILLARAAEQTLDVQYYIWHGDITGTLLLEELHAAADRGVRVRLLLDDNGTVGLDTELAALAQHPQIEVRLFNPFRVRKPKWIGFLTDFSRLNRRMHNKSFTADNSATIIGGRNIGDEYFGATSGVLFTDLDVLAVGPVVDAVSTDFDRYWASGSAYPVEQILPEVTPDHLTQLAERAALIERNSKAASYVSAVARSSFIRQLLDGDLSMEWAPTRMVTDDPAKGLGKAAESGLLTWQLSQILDRPAQSVVLISPYFVPTAAGVESFTALARRGVDVRILTNSLDATDVSAVHAGYAKRRRDLLAGGVRLFEMRRLSPHQQRNESAGPFGSSGSSLHAKTFAVDGQRILVGSFNFDPRSANLNTELGFVIDSPVLAQRVHDMFEYHIPGTAYEVRLDDSGALHWIEQIDDQTIRHTREPNTGLFKRLSIHMLALLPIEWLL